MLLKFLLDIDALIKSIRVHKCGSYVINQSLIRIDVSHKFFVKYINEMRDTRKLNRF